MAQQEDKTFKQKSKWTSVTDKPFKIGVLRKITDCYESGNISYGRMVEMLNEIAINWYNSTISKMEIPQQITSPQKDKQKKLITEVMQADEKDGLYEPRKTAVAWLTKELHARGPIGEETPIWVQQLFEQAKVMEKEQRIKDYNAGYIDGQCNHINDAENYVNEQNYLTDENITT